MTRDNFTQRTKEMLGYAVGYNCVRPGCAKPTTAMIPDTGAITRISIAAHDSAASPGGARYDENLTHEQRKSIDNGALLCPTCARLVDVDPDRFPVGTIQGWQRQATEYRRLRMHMPHQPMGLDFKTSCEAAQLFLVSCKDININRWDQSISWATVCAAEKLLHLSHPMIATNSYCAQFPHMVNLQIEMLCAIRLVINEVKNSVYWYRDDSFNRYYLRQKTTVYPSTQDIYINTAIDRSFYLVSVRLEDFYNLQNELFSIAYSAYSTIDLYGW